jgi:hypothetical protein
MTVGPMTPAAAPPARRQSDRRRIDRDRRSPADMYFSFDNLRFRYEPYPIGVARPLIDASTYRELVASYPAAELFAYLPKVGHKYTLSEKSNPEHYAEIVRTQPLWRELHRWIKSDSFIVAVMDALRAHHIDLGYHGEASPGQRLRKAARRIARGHLDFWPSRLRSRFEFSMLPADGGSVIPHTDSPGKIITLIISMAGDGEWNPAFGGGTDVNRPRAAERIFNELNRRAEFDDMEVLETFEFLPNQAVVFVKTFNSWHSVRPMTGAGSKAMRRTLTINIETDH